MKVNIKELKEKIEKTGYFKVPNFIVESGLWANMSNDEKAVYIVYCYHSREGNKIIIGEDEISVTGITKSKLDELTGLKKD